MRTLLSGLFFLILGSSVFAMPQYIDETNLSCIRGEFSHSRNQNGKFLNQLRVTNNCSHAVNMQQAKISFESNINVNTEFWGTFAPLSYPEGNLKITSERFNNRYKASLTLNLPTWSRAITILPAGGQITIKWITPQQGYINSTFSITLANNQPPVNQTPVSRNGQLRVCGKQLCNQQGQPVQLKGLSSHGIQWKGIGVCLTQPSLDALVNLFKVDVFRIAMYVQENGYETNPQKFTQDVNTLIEDLTNRGLYVIVDFHILTPGDPMHNLDRARRFFTDIATRHRNKNNIIYEIANEPNRVPWSRVKSYAENIIPLIRSIDNKAPIIVGTPGWSSLGVADGRNADDIINDPLRFDNIMYAYHFYAASHGDYNLREFDRATNHLPIFVSEFGTMSSSGDGGNDFPMTDRYMEIMARKKIGWIYWNYSDNNQASGLWKVGTCPSGPWNESRFKESGHYIKNKLNS